MTNVVVIHGTKGSPKSNWFPWLAAELAQRGVSVAIPKMPTPEGQSLVSWFQASQAEIAQLNSQSILIGHSLGAAFILRILEQASVKIAGVVLVSGFVTKLGIPEYDQLNESFVSGEFNWNKIRSSSSNFLCINSNNDPYVPLEQGRNLAASLQAELIVISLGGHLNADSGYLIFPELMIEIDRLLKKLDDWQ